MATRSTRPSRWWIVATAAAAILSGTAGVGALVHHGQASRLIGEGELLWEDGSAGLQQVEGDLAAGSNPGAAVRRLRNELENEAVALLDDTGNVIASSSATLEGTSLDDPTLRSALDNERFGAVAGEIRHDLLLDGVKEWEEGDVLYMSLFRGEDHNLLLFYDIGALMGRRVRAEGVQAGTVQLASVFLFFLVVALLTWTGRSRAIQRFREMSLEAEYMRKESEALHELNAELREARTKAERALELAEENNRIRSEFVLMINHELRTPLTSVVTGAELLRASQHIDVEEKEILESLVHDGRRLQSMIDQLLALARVENRGLAFTPQPIGLGKACDMATDAHSRAIHRSRPGSHGMEGDVEVLTDIQTLTQLVASLVDNAYTHGASCVEVDCSAQPDREPQLVVGDTPERGAALSVIDDGPGIRPDFLPRAFEKFEKDSRSAGTGLGLYMARIMAEAIGAALHVWTSPAGTTISIVMPVSEARMEAA